MQLSEAIMLGSTLLKAHAGGAQRGRGNGCALDMALVAIGVKGHWSDVSRYWPWTREHADVVSGSRRNWKLKLACEFDELVMGYDHVPSVKMTLEQFADYVRSVEPPAAPIESPVETFVSVGVEVAA